MNWKTNHIQLPDSNVGDKLKVRFHALQEIQIKALSSSCGCSIPQYDEATKELVVQYVPTKVPKHLKKAGFYNTTKTITVTHKDGTVDKLTFSVKVSK